MNTNEDILLTIMSVMEDLLETGMYNIKLILIGYDIGLEINDECENFTAKGGLNAVLEKLLDIRGDLED